MAVCRRYDDTPGTKDEAGREDNKEAPWCSEGIPSRTDARCSRNVPTDAIPKGTQ